MAIKKTTPRKLINKQKEFNVDIVQVRFDRLVSDIVREQKIIKQSTFGLKASEVRYLRLGPCYRAEIRAAQER